MWFGRPGFRLWIALARPRLKVIGLTGVTPSNRDSIGFI